MVFEAGKLIKFQNHPKDHILVWISLEDIAVGSTSTLGTRENMTKVWFLMFVDNEWRKEWWWWNEHNTWTFEEIV